MKFIIIDRYGGEYDNEKDKGPGWTTVPSNEFTKFTMKRSPAKKFLETGATVIYIDQCHIKRGGFRFDQFDFEQ